MLYANGRVALMNILSGRQPPGASKELLDLAQELQKKVDAGELLPVLPKDLGWEDEPEEGGE